MKEFGEDNFLSSTQINSVKSSLLTDQSKIQFGIFREIISLIPNLILIINQNRNIVYHNKPKLFQGNGLYFVNRVGQRIGDFLMCTIASNGKLKCGESEVCENCGANRATLMAKSGMANEQEYRINRVNSDPLDLKILAKPLAQPNDNLTLLIITDVSNEKRRSALERTFFP